MSYLKLKNGVPEPYTLHQLRKDNPSVSFPKDMPDSLLSEYGVYPYTRPDVPEHDSLTTKIVDSNIQQDSVGKWVWGYKVEPLSLTEIERNVRTKRDRLLADTDWVVVKAYELGETVAAEWTHFRQALRDVPTQAGFPFSVAWPSQPA